MANTEAKSWTERFSEMLCAAFQDEIPDDVLDRSAIQLLDSIACAAGAVDAEPVRIVQRVIEDSGPQESTVMFAGRKASVQDAVLANGTAVRYLDANDVFLGTGPGGHPSDNIAVALAVAERSGQCGRSLLAVIALSYEMVVRIRTALLRNSHKGEEWDGVSVSSMVAAAMTGLLMGARPGQLANAIAIGAVKGYTLKEIRRGEISMLKASGNAIVAREGVLAGLLAMAGMTGPELVLEGRHGMVATLGGTPTDEMVDILCARPQWEIRNISIKPVPAIGTSQAAIQAAAQLSHELAGSDLLSRIEKISIVLPEGRYTRGYLDVPQRQRPKSRESADHSIPFLAVLALTNGGVRQKDYDNERWLDQDIESLMARTEIIADRALADSARHAFPSIVEVKLHDGRTLRREVLAPQGSPAAPWGFDEVTEKFQRLDRTNIGRELIEQISEAVRNVASAQDLHRLTTLLSSPVSRSNGHDR